MRVGEGADDEEDGEEGEKLQEGEGRKVRTFSSLLG